VERRSTLIDNLPNTLFLIVMALAVIGWLALIVFPRQSWANFWFSGVAVPLLLSVVYMFLLITYWFRPPAAALTQFLSLDGVFTMFGNKGLLLVAWINIVAMDLVVGAWMARKAAQIRMPYLYLLPCLVLTFVFAGFGFALYSLMVAMGGRWSQVSRFEGQPPTNTAPVLARPSAE
jgi:ABA4-like protein